MQAITEADVAAEHRLALSTLTSAQRAALCRLAEARQLINFNHRTEAENLAEIFRREAIVRTARRGVDGSA